MRPFNTSRGGRRGTVTVIVVSFLMIFLVLALTFAFYSISEAENAKVYSASVNVGQNGSYDAGPDPDADGLFNQALNDIIYGPPDGYEGAFNVLRGHDLGRLVYGRNIGNPALLPARPDLHLQERLDAKQPFNGIGHTSPFVRYPFLAAVPNQGDPNGQASVRQMVNYAWAPTVPGLNGMMFEIDNNYYRDPVTGARTPADPSWVYRYYAKNANYTYADLNNLFLAILDPKTGELIAPSYHRRWLAEDPNKAVPPNFPKDLPPANPQLGPVGGPTDPVGPLTQFANANNTDPWTNPWGRLAILRPRPVDHQWPPGSGQSFFPYPTIQGDPANPGSLTYGDVENISGKPGGPKLDALWMDLDAPVRTWRGKRYKALYAITILDLDGRVNVNTAGNFHPLPDAMQPPAPAPLQYEHTSNQGIFGYEVNPARVIGSNNEAAMLSRRPLVRTGSPSPLYVYGTPATHNRFGIAGTQLLNGTPEHRYWSYTNETGQNTPPGGSGAPFYSQVDFDGRYPPVPAAIPRYHDMATGRHTNLIFGPGFVGDNTAPGNPPRPDQTSRYGNGLLIPGFYDERLNHFSMYNPDLVRNIKSASQGWDRVFGVEEMRLLNEQYNFNQIQRFPGSDLATLARNTLGNPRFGANQLNARFAITTLSRDLGLPGADPWRSAPATDYQLAAAGGPAGPATVQPYPTGTAQVLTPSDWTTPAPGTNAMLPPPDHDQFYRAKLAQLGPVDMNRKLTDYRLVANRPLSPLNIGNASRAVQDRQELARDIFARLRAVTTGVVDLTPPVPNQPPTINVGVPEFSALRWLAQLAVNIVDFIDPDDMMTPFRWCQSDGNFKNEWVYGFERPRLVMNETYIRYENRTSDMGQPSATYPPNLEATEAYDMKCWIELHNPITPQTPGEQQMDPMGDGLMDPMAPDGTYGGYRTHLEVNLGGMTQQSAYRILVYKVMRQGAQQNGQQMSAPDNVIGIPGNVQGFGAMNQPMIVKFDGAGVKAKGGKIVHPNVGAQASGNSFFLLGPKSDGQNGADAKLPDPNNITADITLDNLDLPMEKADVGAHNEPLWVPMFVLQRLANPYVPYSGDQNPNDLSQGPAQKDNPYVTIDFLNPDLEHNQVMLKNGMGNKDMPSSIYDNVKNRHDGKRGQNPQSEEDAPDDLSQSFAWGRRQPYDARINFKQSPQPNEPRYRQESQPAGMMGNIGGHTFTKVNGKGGNWPNAMAQPGNSVDQSPGSLTPNDETLQVPFLPLNHLDRIVFNPAELLHVAAVKPHEVGQNFKLVGQAAPTYLANPRRLAYTANWLDAPDPVNLAAASNKSTFLFRALDFLRTSPGMEGAALGGRTAGKINLNTTFAKEVYDAIADRNAANRFQQVQDVDAAWAAMMTTDPNTGTPGRNPQGNPVGSLPVTRNDKPYHGLAAAVEKGVGNTDPNLKGRERTIARTNGLWREQINEDVSIGNLPGAAGAAEKFELFSKTMSQFTTRSNCFAVYMTMGYYEVMNDGPYTETNRPILGKEVGTDDGSVVRNKFFAIIDRTNLSIEQTGTEPIKQGQAPVYFRFEPAVPQPSPAVVPDPDLLLGNAQPAFTPPTAGVGAQVQCLVPAVSQTFGQSPPYPPNKTVTLTGFYDGATWKIVDDPLNPQQSWMVSQAILDVGPAAERVTVRLPQNSFNQSIGTATIILEGQGTNGAFQYRHARGAPIRLLNPDPAMPAADPGHPGPQPGFSYKSPRYAPVVRYAEQLK